MKSLFVRTSLAAVFFVAALFISSLYFPLEAQRIDLLNGKLVFSRNCSSCHSIDSKGFSEMGPNLSRIAQVASTRVPGQSKEQYLWDSIIYPDRFKATTGVMPGGFAQTLNEQELRNLVAFLAGVGNNEKPDYRRILTMTTPKELGTQSVLQDISLRSINEGHRLFVEKFRCSACHHTGESFPGSDLLGPVLNSVGLYDREVLRQSIREPSMKIHPRYLQVKGIQDDGSVVTGRILRKSDESVTLLQADAQGRLSTIEVILDELEENSEGLRLIPQDISSMPNWDTDQMSDTELEAILDFLTVLRG
jgi:cytochrome c2